MFARKEKPLPPTVFEVIPPSQIQNPQSKIEEGIFLGEDCYWNPAALPNGHVVAIGASGSGKTQTLKAIAYSLRQTYPDIQIFVIDFHGDQEIEGEASYPLHMASPQKEILARVATRFFQNPANWKYNWHYKAVACQSSGSGGKMQIVKID